METTQEYMCHAVLKWLISNLVEYSSGLSRYGQWYPPRPVICVPNDVSCGNLLMPLRYLARGSNLPSLN